MSINTHLRGEGERRKQTGVIRDEKADVGVIQHGGDTNQTGTPAGDDGNIFPGVLARLALAVHLVVKAGYGLP